MSLFSLGTRVATGAAKIAAKAPAVSSKATKAIDVLKISRPATAAVQSATTAQKAAATLASQIKLLQRFPGVRLPSKLTGQISAAAKVATTSKTVQTAAKIGILGGAVAGGGILASVGIEAAIVKPFQQLGLVTTDPKTGKPVLTNTGKAAIVALGIAVIGGIILIGVKK
jgi:hypothetical protein